MPNRDDTAIHGANNAHDSAIVPPQTKQGVDLCVLLPLTSKGAVPSAIVPAVARLAASMHSAQSPYKLAMVMGIDEDDPLLSLKEELVSAAAGFVKVITFPLVDLLMFRHYLCAPICWMWNKLAEYAVAEFNPIWTILLGDDVDLRPHGWPATLLDFASRHPNLLLIPVIDDADPGYPSFAAVNSLHLKIFGSMFPSDFINQGGDPFLDALHRSFNAAKICPEVHIRNAIGGMEGSLFEGSAGGNFIEPRYERHAVPLSRFRQLLADARIKVRESLDRQQVLQVAVAIPAYRCTVKNIEDIISGSTCKQSNVNIRVFIHVDNPTPPLELAEGLKQFQIAMPSALRLRKLNINLGAAEARNRLLDEAGVCGADYVIFFDDDVEPSLGCIDAYVNAFLNSPDYLAFAGPTFLPPSPNEVLPTAILMSDVGFFWDAPASMQPHVPWAVTANMAVKYTNVRFRDIFPKTGGGEDVDFCVLLGHRLKAVPEASAVHPWWPQRRPKIYLRFWGWAAGDGRLIDLWPELTYRRAPNTIEQVLVVSILCMLGLLLLSTAASAVVGIIGAELVMDVSRNCFLADRRAVHPCRPSLRVFAAAESCVVKLFSEAGRAWGHIKRRHWSSFFRNFDWFCGDSPEVVVGEQRTVFFRAVVRGFVAVLVVFYGRSLF